MSYTYKTVWTKSTSLYTVIRCNDETHEREIVASFDELSEEENRILANKFVDMMNGKQPDVFKKFSQTNRKRCESENGFNQKLTDWNTSDWMLATFGELGEAANVAKKLNRYRDGIAGNMEDEKSLQEQLRKELGDTMVYLDLMAQSLGIDILAAAIEVFNNKSKQLNMAFTIEQPHDTE